MDKNWKADERRVARQLGTKRNPPTGEGVSDFDDENFSYEHKKRMRLPTWIHEAMEQAEVNTKDGHWPAVILSEVNQGKKPIRYVVVTLDIWKEILDQLDQIGVETWQNK